MMTFKKTRIVININFIAMTTILILLSFSFVKAQNQSSGLLTNYKEHTIEKGESLSKISKIYGVEKNDILKANPELIDGLTVGKKIKIPVTNKITNQINSNNTSQTSKIENSEKDNNEAPIKKNEESQETDKSKVITLTQIGQGKTKDAAKYNALRSAIEKAFGAFISSNTSLLNDELVKDEIVSVSSGNIQHFEILSETQMPDGSYSSVVKATVSIGKLTTFCENKGISVEFKGGLFTANIKMQELNKKNEEAVMGNLYTVIKSISKNLYDYSITVGTPKVYSQIYSSYWEVPITLSAKMNSNINSIGNMITQTIKGISLSPEELNTLNSQHLRYYKVIIANSGSYYLRSNYSQTLMNDLFLKIIPYQCTEFELSNGITTYSFSQINNCIKNSKSSDENFKCQFTKDEVGMRSNYISAVYNMYFKYINRPDVYNSDKQQKDTQGRIVSAINKLDDSNKNTLSIYFNDYNSGDMEFDFQNSMKSEFTFNFNNVLTVGQLSKVTAYKVNPIK